MNFWDACVSIQECKVTRAENVSHDVTPKLLVSHSLMQARNIGFPTPHMPPIMAAKALVELVLHQEDVGLGITSYKRCSRRI